MAFYKQTDFSSATSSHSSANPSDLSSEASSEKLLHEEEDGERGYLWLESEKDMGRLQSIGILDPVLIDPDDNIGVKIIAFVPQSLYSALRVNKFAFIKAFEDPEGASNYSYYFFN
jgi:hypothetical protein